MYNPKQEQITAMVTRFAEKHKDDLNWLQLRFEVLDLYDSRYSNGLIQQTLPRLDIDFK